KIRRDIPIRIGIIISKRLPIYFNIIWHPYPKNGAKSEPIMILLSQRQARFSIVSNRFLPATQAGSNLANHLIVHSTQ
ncbi:MAG: hypothetical protein IJR17_04530, partial [Clostridia bacterium]|nr:hypothetical protein [Clostridia bacterium]